MHVEESYIKKLAFQRTGEYRKRHGVKKADKQFEEIRKVAEAIALEAFTYGQEVGISRYQKAIKTTQEN